MTDATRQQWYCDFEDDTPDNRLDGRIALLEMGAVRFSYRTEYSLISDAMVLRVMGYSW